ncbi:cytidine deaminase [Pseudodesulfovibrio senegalensis]|uniref:Cytidine deaminase n=1 Tax=Pseudodesulfovibrio senegalensis TaxID=1721087 RepID=A0A6N6MZ18_9BACT|nr:cytidine deaminase [Pseudodesulfovibrio senegalensis]KAB1439116.1 cytidine deaminase [Pseudodesulfovibrio senegalensis]
MADISELMRMATRARNNAHAPYSGHPVGAALRTSTGKTYAGCNVENIAYPVGTCAEQAAICAMVLDGESSIAEMVVTGPGNEPCTPCGACRQRMREFAAPDMLFHACTETDVLLTMTMDQLLPEAFGPEYLK